MKVQELKDTWERHMKAFDDLDKEDPDDPAMVYLLQHLLAQARYATYCMCSAVHSPVLCREHAGLEEVEKEIPSLPRRTITAGAASLRALRKAPETPAQVIRPPSAPPSSPKWGQPGPSSIHRDKHHRPNVQHEE